MPNRLRIITALETLLMELRETSIEGYSAALKISHRDLMDALVEQAKRLDRIEGEVNEIRAIFRSRFLPDLRPPLPPEPTTP